MKVTWQGSDISFLSFICLISDDNDGRINIRSCQKSVVLVCPLVIVSHSGQNINITILDFRQRIGKIIGIELKDNIIIGSDSYISLYKNGYIDKEVKV